MPVPAASSVRLVLVPDEMVTAPAPVYEPPASIEIEATPAALLVTDRVVLAALLRSIEKELVPRIVLLPTLMALVMSGSEASMASSIAPSPTLPVDWIKRAL